MKALVYLLQVSACTAVFYLFYRLLLSRLTFFTINRWFLLATVFLSFIIPVLTIPVNPRQQHIAVVQQAVYINTLQTVPVNVTDVNVTQITEPIDWMQLLKFSYLVAVIGLAFHLIITLILFFRRLKGKQLTKVGHVNIVCGNNKFNNGSFFNYIFLNDQELSADEMQQIIAHEMLHVKLYHSVDRLLLKLAQIILWFNPFIYLYAKAVEENHEFEVDCAMANSTDKKMYADLLLHLSVAGQGLLYHSFSKIPLKKRITMLFNQPSAKMKKVIYVLILPVVLISCLAFARLKSTSAKHINKVEKSEKKPLIFKDPFYKRSRQKNIKGEYYDKIFVQTKQQNGRSTSANISISGKAVFLIDNKSYTEEEIQNNSNSFISTLLLEGVWFGSKKTLPADVAKYNVVFILHTKNTADTTKYRQKLKRSPEQIKGEADFKAYRETADFKQKEKQARDVQGKTITVKIKEIVDRDARKNSDMFISNNGRVKGFMVVYNNEEYFMRTVYGQEKQLNNLLKVGDEITIKVFISTFGRNAPNMIEPAFIEKNNVKIFQLAEADKIPDYPFLYEANKVRYADGQITHIQKYPNGKWKSAVLEIVNGYKLNLNFKPNAPDFNGIEEYDHVRFRFVHEVKTGAKTYQINDWVSISNNKDYGIKNPELFYKFYEPTVAQNQDSEHNFKVTSLTYQASEKVVAALKKDQHNSYISVGKSININTLKSEQGRVYRFLAAMFPQVEKKNIVFNVDTTLQKGFCTIKTVVKPSV